ncbi:hypothetical protein C8R46DRAFT_1061363 [Mycena filopes]|nr:hypothetical protein C8R46DRAFT_1061363 [Mycena filopes]
MLVRRAPASLRQYATRAAIVPKSPNTKSPASAAVSPPPAAAAAAPPPPAKPLSLRARMAVAQQTHYMKTEGLWDENNQKMLSRRDVERKMSGLDEAAKIEALIEQAEKHRRDHIRFKGYPPPLPELPIFDYTIPYSVGFKARREYSSIGDAFRQFKRNMLNHGKNLFAMRHIDTAHSFPGVKQDPALGWFRRTLRLRNLLQAQSLKSTAWVAPLRQEFLDLYIEFHQALQKGNSAKLRSLTMMPYTRTVTRLLQKKDSGVLYRWRFHREVTPTRILSLRSSDGWYYREMPETGSRIGVQALVRFDTEQSLEMYDKASGKALHTPAPTAAPRTVKVDGKLFHTVPAVPKRVTEYLIVDRAFYDPEAGWRLRARVEPGEGRTLGV